MVSASRPADSAATARQRERQQRKETAFARRHTLRSCMSRLGCNPCYLMSTRHSLTALRIDYRYQVRPPDAARHSGFSQIGAAEMSSRHDRDMELLNEAQNAKEVHMRPTPTQRVVYFIMACVTVLAPLRTSFSQSRSLVVNDA